MPRRVLVTRIVSAAAVASLGAALVVVLTRGREERPLSCLQTAEHAALRIDPPKYGRASSFAAVWRRSTGEAIVALPSHTLRPTATVSVEEATAAIGAFVDALAADASRSSMDAFVGTSWVVDVEWRCDGHVERRRHKLRNFDCAASGWDLRCQVDALRGRASTAREALYDLGYLVVQRWTPKHS